MKQDETQTTGTPGATQEGANAATAASGTPAASTDGGNAGELSADERAELGRLKAAHQQGLAEKETLERLKWENEQLREAQAQRANPPATGYGYAAPPNPLQERFAAVSERDPEVAALFIEQVRATQQEFAARDAKLKYREELAGVPSADRAEVERIAKSEGIWPDLAHAKLIRERHNKQVNELAEQSRKVQEERDRLSRGVTRTDASPAPPASRSTEITSTEYERLIAAAQRGDRDARKKLDDVDNEVIRVRPG